MLTCCNQRCDQGRRCPKRQAKSLPDLLLSTEAMTGPYRRTRPVTRWSTLLRRACSALGVAVRTLSARAEARRWKP